MVCHSNVYIWQFNLLDPNFEKPVIFPPIPEGTMKENKFDEDIVTENEFNMNLTTPLPDDFKNHSNIHNVTMDMDIIPEEDFNMDLTLLWILLAINGGLYGILLIIYGFKLKNSKKKKALQDHSIRVGMERADEISP